MRYNLLRNFILTCCAIAVFGLLFIACGASPHLEETPTAPSFYEEFSSTQVDGQEFAVLPGQAVVMYADHLPQAGGSGDTAISNAELDNQLKILAFSPSFKQIPAVWGLLNHCSYTIFVDAYYIGTIHITIVDAKLAHQIVEKWSTDNHVATHYTSADEIPCLAP